MSSRKRRNLERERDISPSNCSIVNWIRLQILLWHSYYYFIKWERLSLPKFLTTSSNFLTFPMLSFACLKNLVLDWPSTLHAHKSTVRGKRKINGKKGEGLTLHCICSLVSSGFRGDLRWQIHYFLCFFFFQEFDFL